MEGLNFTQVTIAVSIFLLYNGKDLNLSHDILTIGFHILNILKKASPTFVERYHHRKLSLLNLFHTLNINKEQNQSYQQSDTNI